jgi:hypothetical protein
MKRCFKCGEEKNVDCFSRRKSSKDGLQARCKVCHRARSKEEYKRDRAEILSRRKMRYASRPAIVRSEIPPKGCRICGEVKSPYSFSTIPGMKDGLDSRCRDCVRKINNKWTQKHAQENRLRAKRYHEKFRDKVLSANHKKRDEIADTYVRGIIKNKTGLPAREITPDLIDAEREIIITHRLLNRARKEGLNDEKKYLGRHTKYEEGF